MTVAKAAEHESASSATAVAAFPVSVTFFSAAMPIDGNAAVARLRMPGYVCFGACVLFAENFQKFHVEDEC